MRATIHPKAIILGSLMCVCVGGGGGGGLRCRLSISRNGKVPSRYR